MRNPFFHLNQARLCKAFAQFRLADRLLGQADTESGRAQHRLDRDGLTRDKKEVDEGEKQVATQGSPATKGSLPEEQSA